MTGVCTGLQPGFKLWSRTVTWVVSCPSRFEHQIITAHKQGSLSVATSAALRTQ